MSFASFFTFGIPGPFELIVYALLGVAIVVGAPFAIAWAVENMFLK